MYPELFQFELPELISRLLSIKQVTIYSYPFCILLGTVLAYTYFLYAQKKQIRKRHLALNFLVLIFVMAYMGGKIFLILENPSQYFLRAFTVDFYVSGGFVFYGSFLFCLSAIIYVLFKKGLPILQYLDIIAIVAAIVHSVGRLGCFLAGCCYGKPTTSFYGVYFPKNPTLAVHPTQLYEAVFIGLLLVILLRMSRLKRSNGTVFSFYIYGYATWRFMLEYLRGDNRGYVFNDLFSHSQIIALVIIIGLSAFLFIKHKTIKTTQ
jgi:phosphatidylglycerol:prolipoprotein diacylglycerol transferase